MQLSFSVLLSMSMFCLAASSHCSTLDRATTLSIASPADGQTTTYSGSLTFDEGKTLKMTARAGCTYRLSFCPADGGAAASAGEICDTNVYKAAPWVQVFNAAAVVLKGCVSPASTCSDGTARTGVSYDWTAATTETVYLAIDTYCSNTLPSFTLAVKGTGAACNTVPAECLSSDIYLDGTALPTSVVKLTLPSATQGDIALKVSSSGTTAVIKSLTHQTQLSAGQTCNTNNPAYFYNSGSSGAKTNLDNHMFYASQSSLLRSTIQSNQIAQYQSACDKTVIVPVTCINGQVSANICFKADCPTTRHLI